jgi:hypothetical protein
MARLHADIMTCAGVIVGGNWVFEKVMKQENEHEKGKCEMHMQLQTSVSKESPAPATSPYVESHHIHRRDTTSCIRAPSSPKQCG